jgi:hypothetical protein
MSSILIVGCMYLRILIAPVKLMKSSREFELALPFSLRCRAAFLSMPSRYTQASAAVDASPEPSRIAMTSSFQQTNLAINISETLINLHRPYYAKALYNQMDSRTKALYEPSFLTVIERCAVCLHRNVKKTS